MQPTNKPVRQQSRCMYCGSTTRGKGCRFGPHGVHFHPDDATKCAYCGSPNYGKGCKINPTSDLHIHGINYNSMFKENVQSYLDNEIFMKELLKDFKQFDAYMHELIDEHGNKIKEPVTEEEHLALNPFIKTIIRIKKYLGPKIDLLSAQQTLEEATNNLDNIQNYEKFLAYKDRIDNIVNSLYQVFEEAKRDGVDYKHIKKLIGA